MTLNPHWGVARWRAAEHVLMSSQSCMTEEQKYQGALYKNKKAKTTNNSNPPAQSNMAHRAYVEDVVDYEGWEDVEVSLPRAPTPPAPSDLDVFQFMNNPTPTASTVALPQAAGPSEAEPSDRNQLVRFEEPKDYDDVDAEMMADDEGFAYGAGMVPAGAVAYETPLPKATRERKRSDKSAKKDKKRKRPHVPTLDLDMPDAPVLHSGLTGGLNRMMSRPQEFPPSPDYSGSGGELGETPASPLKKSKHSKHHRSSRHESSSIGNNLFSMLTSGTTKTASKSKKRKQDSGTTSSKKRHSSSHHKSKRLEGAKEVKLLEGAKDEGGESQGGAGAVVVFGHGADLFFNLVDKSVDRERGCSVKKALRRFHRERGDADDSLPRPLAEKELFRSLRMRRNDRGEIVLFCA